MCMQKLAAAKYALQSCKSRMTPWSNSFHIFRYVVILGFRIEGKRKKGKHIFSRKKGNRKLGNPVNFRVYIHAMNRMKKKF